MLIVPALLSGCDEQDAASDPAPRHAGVRLSNLLGEVGDAGFARADRVRAFRFPDDHGPHPEFRSEWWYLVVALEGPGGEYGVQFTVFRQGLVAGADPLDRWRNGQAWLAHLAVTEVGAARHREFERLGRGHPELAGARNDPFAVWLEDWRLEAAGDGFRLAARAEGFEVGLQLAPDKPVVLRGDRGLSRKGEVAASYYYSMPRLSAGGELVIDGRHIPVEGQAWFDREWSTSVLGPDLEGWDWFALMLDDGRDLSVYRLRRRDGGRDPFDHGVLVQSDGSSRTLTPDDFELTPLQFREDELKVRWPIRWRLGMDGIELEIRALVDDQRMDTLLTYWEGLVEVRDPAGRRLGRGYMELTGY
jgi:predicted secreted hydrolase